MSTSQRWLLAGPALLAFALLGCAVQPGHPAAPLGSRPATTPSSVAPSATPPADSPATASAPPSGNVYTTAFPNVTSLSAQPAGMYVTWSAAGSTSADPPDAFLTRFAAATGRVAATRSFGQAFTTKPVAAAGWLWTVLSRPGGAWLLRLDPLTLATTATTRLAGTDADSQYGAQPVAYAGAGIWVAGGGQLVHVSPTSMSAMRALTLPARSAGASADGQVLVVSEATATGGTIERRDPVTGALLASYPVAGVTAPAIESVTSDGAWMAEPTGMLGYVEHFSTALAPQPATEADGTNGIQAALADGTLWVTAPPGARGLNYCADPVTGQRLASIPLPDVAQDTVATIGSAYVYYTYYSSGGGGGERIGRAQVPAACLR